MYYLRIILPLAFAEEYHYRLPMSLMGHRQASSIIGCRVVVSLGKRRFYTGIVSALDEALPLGVSADKIKLIEQLVDEVPIVTPDQLETWQWLSLYYHCHLGQVMRIALPGGLLPESGTMVYLSEDFVAEAQLSQQETDILDTLASAPKQMLSMESLRSRLGRLSTTALMRLIEQGAVYTEELVRTRYMPRQIEYIRLGAYYRSDTAIAELLETLKRAPRQVEIMMEYLSLMEGANYADPISIPRQDLSQGEAQRGAIIRKLIERGALEIELRAVSRLEPSGAIGDIGTSSMAIEPLTAQTTLLYAEQRAEREAQIVAQVAEAIRAGKQVLLLTPSAYDAPSSASYLAALHEAAGSVYYYHPAVSESRRTELYLHLQRNPSPCLIIGTRGAVFLPMHALGLIIVDQEQEYMYKQQFTPPYFHARDVALYLASRSEAVRILLATSTPSAEVLFNALRGKYALRYHPAETNDLSERVHTIDLGQWRTTMRREGSELISPPLWHEIAHTISAGGRVLLLQNRRGYAPYLLCQGCGARVSCPHCAVSLTYYAARRELRCSYCTYSMPVPVACPSCGVYHIADDALGVKPALQSVGYGVERVVEEVEKLFPNANVLRIDSDTLQTARQREEVHSRIESGDVDIIVGTQLIKGQPLWDNISLIGVVQLDSLIGFPDFRSHERAYQLLHQLLHRSADYAVRPHLWLQTFDPDSPFIRNLRELSYDHTIRDVLAERQVLNLPPFVRITYITLRAGDERLVDQIGQTFVRLLQAHLGDGWVSDLKTPSVARIDMQYIRQIVCRRPFSQSYSMERTVFSQTERELRTLEPLTTRVRICYDVDPL